jgi:predicted DNA-binding protein with PD1-like motif
MDNRNWKKLHSDVKRNGNTLINREVYTLKYSLARQGRVFVIRLEDGDILHEEIEKLAVAQGVRAAALLAVGGADAGSTLVVGPEKGRVKPIVPLEQVLDDVHEVAGVGTLFPDETGRPVLHMHGAFGRKTSTITGCVRTGVRVWHVLEVIMIELTDTEASRRLDEITGFKLLKP